MPSSFFLADQGQGSQAMTRTRMSSRITFKNMMVCLVTLLLLSPATVIAQTSSAPSSAPSVPGTTLPTAIEVVAPTTAPAETCGAYREACVAPTDCCSERCVLNACQKKVVAPKETLSAGRGGAAGAAKQLPGGRLLDGDRVRRSVRGST